MTRHWTDRVKTELARKEEEQARKDAIKAAQANKQLKMNIERILGAEWELNFEGEPEDGKWQDTAGYMWEPPSNACSSHIRLSYPLPPELHLNKRFGRKTKELHSNIRVEDFEQLSRAYAEIDESYQRRVEDVRLAQAKQSSVTEDRAPMAYKDLHALSILRDIVQKIEDRENLYQPERLAVEFAVFAVESINHDAYHEDEYEG